MPTRRVGCEVPYNREGRSRVLDTTGQPRAAVPTSRLILTQPTYNSTGALATAVPTLAIVGRPNVGKSTLFNRIVGSRRAIVGDEPGITRDRLYGDAEWRGRRLRIVDTGGILPEEKDLIPAEIFRQARVALDEAAAIIMVVDGRSELAGPDLELARLLRRANRPLFLAVNKVDSEKQSSLIDEFHRLGIPQMFPVSAEHGRGVDDLLDAVIAILPPEPSTTEGQPANDQQLFLACPERGEGTSDTLPVTEAPHEVKVAIIGHPNVGKSTLLNCLTASDRAIVSPVPGTTRDAVDEVVERNGRRFRFIDTAGIRRKGKTHLMAEKLSVVMARKHLESADIALLVIDATEGVSQLDAAIAGYAHESGRSMIIVVNKWDLVISGQGESGRPTKAERMRESKRPGDRDAYEERVRYDLKFLNYAPIVFISAKSGKGTEKIFPLLEQVASERRKRVTTSEMNRFLEHVDFDRASVPMRQRVKILYMTQASVAPPTFVLFTNRAVKLHFSYQRFLENQIREAFGFVGTPIWIKNRARGS
ncbi:GTPase Der [Candidatus Sulfotelmatobacter kueseliae]|uniref:GTPase Der n=1 Tax=Candidatus Sulfotelmatobacter kueseliae TaxID=2042962 RepID=A0A2U3KFN8_9BACT|nr:GTPase Der [Candidatus Sulfotelmatobacter kueseliae]